MIRTTTAVLAALTLTTAAYAAGDAAKGEKLFKKCKACHVVVDADGNTLAGKRGKVGPNLFGVIGRTAGTVEGFKYGKSIVAAGEAGLVWDAENIASYLQNPKKFLRTYLDDPKAKAKMTFKFRKEADAINMAAFLASVSPAP